MRSCFKPLYCSIKRSFTNWPCSLKGIPIAIGSGKIGLATECMEYLGTTARCEE